MPSLRKSSTWIVLVDVALLGLAFLMAFRLLFGWPPPAANFTPFRNIAAPLAIGNVAIFFGFGLYALNRIRLVELLRGLTLAEGVLFLWALALTFWLRGFAFPRSVLLSGFWLHFLLVSTWRLLVWGAGRRHWKPTTVVIAARHDEGQLILKKFLSQSAEWFNVLCVTDSDDILAADNGTLAYVDVLVIGHSIPLHDRASLMRKALANNTIVQVVPDLDDILLSGAVLDQVDDLSLAEIRPLALSPREQTAKRLFDLSVAIPLLLLASPVMALTWIVSKILSPGPAFFGQERVGQVGCTFTVWKFRTMVVDAERLTGPVLATANDPRITPFGRFLRASRLDELPQLWNVLCGQMSIVGPRPERPVFVEQFTGEMADYPLRHTVPPGVTGLAQVMGHYETSPRDKLRLDLFYVHNYSVWLDVQVLLLTLRAVVVQAAKRPHDPGVATTEAAILRRSYGEIARKQT